MSRELRHPEKLDYSLLNTGRSGHGRTKDFDPDKELTPIRSKKISQEMERGLKLEKDLEGETLEAANNDDDGSSDSEEDEEFRQMKEELA